MKTCCACEDADEILQRAAAAAAQLWINVTTLHYEMIEKAVHRCMTMETHTYRNGGVFDFGNWIIPLPHREPVKNESWQSWYIVAVARPKSSHEIGKIERLSLEHVLSSSLVTYSEEVERIIILTFQFFGLSSLRMMTTCPPLHKTITFGALASDEMTAACPIQWVVIRCRVSASASCESCSRTLSHHPCRVGRLTPPAAGVCVLSTATLCINCVRTFALPAAFRFARDAVNACCMLRSQQLSVSVPSQGIDSLQVILLQVLINVLCVRLSFEEGWCWKMANNLIRPKTVAARPGEGSMRYCALISVHRHCVLHIRWNDSTSHSRNTVWLVLNVKLRTINNWSVTTLWLTQLQRAVDWHIKSTLRCMQVFICIYVYVYAGERRTIKSLCYVCRETC